MKQTIDVKNYRNDDEFADECCTDCDDSLSTKRENSLEQIIAEHQFLSGPEALQLFDLMREVNFLKNRNNIQQEMYILSQSKDKFFKYERHGDEYYAQVLAYEIENENLYIVIESIETGEARRNSSKFIRYNQKETVSVDQFKKWNPKVISDKTFYRRLDAVKTLINL